MALPLKLEELVINRYCTFEYLLSYIGQSFPDRPVKCFCPFHENHDTPAAKLYQNEEGESIFCFTENRSYRPHDLLKSGIVPFTSNHVFSAIWQQLGEEEKSQFEDYVPQSLTQDYSSVFKEYRKGELSYFDLLAHMV